MRESPFKPPSVLYRRRRTRLLVLIAALLASLVLVLGFWVGQQAAYSGMGVDSELYREMQRELPAARERAQALAQELEVQRTRNEVDRKALEIVRSDIARQKEQISGLEEGLRFYRSLMAPGEIAQGLSLRDIELIARTDPGRYAFRIVAQQEALKHQMLKGGASPEELDAMIEGRRTKQPKSSGEKVSRADKKAQKKDAERKAAEDTAKAEAEAAAAAEKDAAEPAPEATEA